MSNIKPHPRQDHAILRGLTRGALDLLRRSETENRILKETARQHAHGLYGMALLLAVMAGGVVGYDMAEQRYLGAANWQTVAETLNDLRDKNERLQRILQSLPKDKGGS